jgi:phosphinothricin acetyltransferase
MTTMTYNIGAMLPTHWEAVRAIYREGIDTRNATFETETPDWQTWDEKHLQQCRLVASVDDQVVGWAALSPVSSRCVYRGVAEVSIYIAASARGQGIGKALLKALVDESEAAGIWTLQAGIFPENAVSVALHKAFGFREVGIRKHIGKMGDTWRNVLLMERRSEIVGI